MHTAGGRERAARRRRGIWPWLGHEEARGHPDQGDGAVPKGN